MPEGDLIGPGAVFTSSYIFGQECTGTRGVPWIGQFDAVAVPPPNRCRLLPRHTMCTQCIAQPSAPVAARVPIVLVPLYYVHVHPMLLLMGLPTLSLILLFFQQLVLVSFAASIPALVPCRN